MKQIIIKTWEQAKEKYPNDIILVHYFKEYYTLNEDAHKMPPCGCRVYRDTEHDGYDFASFPYKELDTFLPRIIRNGNRVGIVDVQTENKNQTDKSMNELELLLKAEMEKESINNRTVDELQQEQLNKAREFCKEMVNKLSFLSKYGCRAFATRTYADFYIDYPYSAGTRTARASLKSELKEYEGKRYTYYYTEEKFYVDWNYHVCHNDKDDYLTTESLIKKLSKFLAKK